MPVKGNMFTEQVPLEANFNNGVRPLPWESYGLVSLLQMLDFAAKDYVEFSYQFGLMVSYFRSAKPDQSGFGKAIDKLLEDCNAMGMLVTRDHIGRMFLEFVKVDTSKASIAGTGDDRMLVLKDLDVDHQRFCHYIETIYDSLRSELSSIKFKAVQREKLLYCDPNWLFDGPIYHSFPSAWKEFQAAGRCFAYGENTACAFHLSRALEWGLKSLAVKLGQRFDRNNWERHIEDIEKELKARYVAAGARSPEEKFYAEAAAQFGNMKVAWRNPTMHIEAQYDEKEGSYLLTTIEKFMTHLADGGLKEKP